MYRLKTKFWVCILATLGAAISALALYEHVVYRYGLATGPSFCNISQHINCEAVNASEWSVFLGLPIASYGLFFYGAVLGLSWFSGPHRRLDASKANQVVFVGALVGSLVSVLLLSISELIIGALCLLCLVLYLVTFFMLAVTWWGAAAGFSATLSGGLRELLSFLAGIIRFEQAKLAGLIGLLLWATVAVSAPAATYEVARIFNRKGGAAGAHTDSVDSDPVAAWSKAQVEQIPLEINSGAFGDYAKGVQGAPIQIVEFADFECAGCRIMYTAMQELLSKYEGKYHFVFKNYPLDSACNPAIARKFHQNSCFAAYFVRCAGEQGRFWQALDYAFTDSVLERDVALGEALDQVQMQSVRDAMLSDGSATLGLDPAALRECVVSERYLARIRDEVAQGNNLRLQSTPSIWVNGRKVERPTPEALDRIFAALVVEHELRTGSNLVASTP